MLTRIVRRTICTSYNKQCLKRLRGKKQKKSGVFAKISISLRTAVEEKKRGSPSVGTNRTAECELTVGVYKVRSDERRYYFQPERGLSDASARPQQFVHVAGRRPQASHSRLIDGHDLVARKYGAAPTAVARFRKRAKEKPTDARKHVAADALLANDARSSGSHGDDQVFVNNPPPPGRKPNYDHTSG